MDQTIAAAVQATPVFLDRDATVEKVARLTKEAASNGARIIVFPETFVPTYPDWVWKAPAWGPAFEALTARLREEAVEVPGPTTDALAKAAKAAKAYLSIGVNEVAGGTIYNTQLSFDPGGHLELARYARYAKGVDIWTAPTWDSGDNWVATLRHIAREGRVYVIGVTMLLRGSDIPQDVPGRDLWGGEDDWVNDGYSAIVDPDGALLAGPLVGEEGILYAEVDADHARAERYKFDPVGHYARPDVFRLVVNEEPKPSVGTG
jgi:nitrilase